MVINWPRRELNLKIVYHGPSMSGKTTNLVRMHESIGSEHRGELISLATEDERTIYFDFLRVDLARIGGLSPRIHLYTVPGQPMYEASRRYVLRGADGIVFVADSAPDRLSVNVEAWRNMEAHLAVHSLTFPGLPLVVQFNKQDLPNALPAISLRYLLRLNGFPCFEAVALHGQGVFETLKAIVGAVMRRVQQALAEGSPAR